MNTHLSYQDIITDEAYNKGYEAGEKKVQKKYNSLHYAAKQFFQMYESVFGEPDKDGSPEFWELKAMLEKS